MILLKGDEDYQMLKILKHANVGFSRFPNFNVEICSEFALKLHLICTAHYRKLKIAQLNVLSRLRFSFFLNGKFTLK